MATHLYDILDTGAGRVDYAWHVSGMPWVSVTDSRLSTYLKAGGSASASACFGSKYYSGIGVNYLTNLDVDRTQWQWTYDDAAGLTGGNHQVNLAEINTGVDWSSIDLGGEQFMMFKTSALWGIPGVSQIFDLQNDSAIPYGNLAADIDTDDLTISVTESRGLWKYLDNLPGTPDGAILWIGHECIGVTSWELETDGKITLTLDNTNKRGLFRTRPQSHTINEYAAQSEYVCPVPLGGIVGRPAQLWAFPATTDGASITYGNPTLICHGKVSQGISIKDGVAKVSVLGPLDWLKSPSPATDYSGKLARFVFQRGIGDVTAPGTATPYGPWAFDNKFDAKYTRSPHLLVREVWGEESEGVLYPKEQWTRVWLCAPGVSITFDTIDEVRLALADEIAKLSAASGTDWESQASGDGTSGNPRQTLHYKYIVGSLGIARQDRSDNTAAWHTIASFDETSFYENTSQIGGPLAAIFGFAHAISYKPTNYLSQLDATTYVEWSAHLVSGINRVVVADSLARGNTLLSQWGAYQWPCKMNSSIEHAPGTDLMQYVPPIDLLSQAFKSSRMLIVIPGQKIDIQKEKRDYFPQYYYEFSKDTASDYSVTGASTGVAGGSFAIPEDTSGNPRLYLQKIAGQIPIIGAAVYIGMENGNPLLECSIDAYGISGEYYYVDVNSLYAGISSTAGANPQNGGSVFSGGDNDSALPHPCLCWIRTLATQNDPWAITQGAAPVEAGVEYGIELLKSVIGASDVITLAPSLSLTWVPEMGPDAGSDGYSWIDWDDLEDKIVPLTADERYYYRGNDQSFIDTFMGFLRSHGLTPYLELTTEATYDLWVMRFRSIGIINVTEAFSSGRFINASIVEYDADTTRDVASGYTYSSIDLKLNYDGEEYGVPVTIRDKSAYAQNGYGAKVFKIEDRLTQCPSLRDIATDAQIQADFAERYTSGILPHISRARPITTAKAVARCLTKLPVGGDVLVTDEYGRNPFTAQVGYSDLPGIVTSVQVNLGSLASKISWRLARGKNKGWAPALYIPAGYIIGGENPTITAQIKNTALHEFSASTDMVDAARFDCWNYDRTTGLYSARSCDCGDYAIQAIVADDPTTAPITGTVVVNDPSNTDNTMVFTMDTAFSMIEGVSDKNYIILFGSWDDAEDCQKDMYVAFCGDDGLTGTADDPGDSWS